MSRKVKNIKQVDNLTGALLELLLMDRNLILIKFIR